MRARPKSHDPLGATLAILLGTGLFSSCAEDRTPFLGPLALHYADGVRADRETRHALLPIPARVGVWNVERGASEIITVAQSDARGLRLTGEEDALLIIPHEAQRGDYDVVRVHLSSGCVASVRGGLLNGDERIVGSSNFQFVEVGQTATLELDVRSARWKGEASNSLVLHVSGEVIDLTVLSVELVRRPPTAWLPTPMSGRNMITAGGEARGGVGLATDKGLSARVVIPAGGYLSFSTAWPRDFPSPQGGAKVVVTVQSGGERAEHDFDLPERVKNTPAWHDQKLSLVEWAGREVTLFLALETSADAAALCAIAEASVYVPADTPRTVLLVTSDTHRADHLGDAQLGVDVRTPTLDALAARGVLFEDCFSSSNITIPSHVALFTGMTPRDTGVINNRMRLTEDARTLAEEFHAAGFATFAITSARHLRPEWSGLGQGFDRMVWPAESESDVALGLAQLETWLPVAEGRPLFVWLHTFDVHGPYKPPAKYSEMYYPKERDAFDQSLPPAEFPVPAWNDGLRDEEWPRAQYRGEVTYLDAMLAGLFERPRFRSGLVAVTSDHGENLGAHALYWNHLGLYPDTLHVPLILAWPDGPQGLRVSHPVQQIDLGRTLLELSDLEAPDFGGVDLRDFIGAESPAETPRFALGSFRDAASINLGRWHLILTLNEIELNEDARWGLTQRHRVELYDRASDRDCEHDLAREPEHFERAKVMRASLITWLGEAGEGLAGGNVLDAESQAVLAQLGYANGGPGGGEAFDPECECEHCAVFAD
jgi:arylsulfatase A-like enzyme